MARVPVEGVVLVVVDSTGAEVGPPTAAPGPVRLELPGPGDYLVRLDEGTLPDEGGRGDAAAAGAGGARRPAERQILNYFLGESRRQTESRWDRLPQTIANGIKFGLIIAITAVGLSLIYGTTGLSNFAHGEMVTLGAIVGVVVEPERRPAHPRSPRRSAMSSAARRASSPRRALATAAPQGRQPDLDDDRVDRRRRSLPLRVPLPVRRPRRGLPEYTCSRRSTSARLDHHARPRRVMASAWSSSSAVALFLQAPARQGDPRGVRQPRPRVGDRASTPIG